MYYLVEPITRQDGNVRIAYGAAKQLDVDIKKAEAAKEWPILRRIQRVEGLGDFSGLLKLL